MPRALDAEKRTEARRLRAAGRSLNQIRDELGIGYSTAQRFTKGVRPDLERSAEDCVKIGAPKRERHDEWVRTAPIGECGGPGCDRPGCPYRGKCHCGCGKEAPIADQDDRERIYVRGLPRRYAQGHRMGESLMAAANGEPLVEALERVGLTRIEASRRAGLSKGAVADLVGIEGHRRRRSSCERIVDVLRAEFEAHGLDASELTLERLFTEQRPANELPPGQRAHRVRRSRPPIPPNERGDGGHFRAGYAQARQEAQAAGVWIQEEALSFLKLTRPAFINMERHGRISGDCRSVGPVRVKVYDPRDVKQLGRELFKSETPWDVRRLSYLGTYTLARNLGTSHVEATRRAELAEARRQALARIRLTGRPASSGPPALHVEWAYMFRRIDAELRATYEAFHVDGDPPPTRWEVAALVANEDYEAHPERWDYSPIQNRRAATRRVWKGVKPLLNAVTETRA